MRITVSQKVAPHKIILYVLHIMFVLLLLHIKTKALTNDENVEFLF